MLKIGVVCEGQTDFVAMKTFIENEFSESERKVELSIIQPAMDNTLPSGWAQVLYWLENNDYEYRSSIYGKNGALFAVEDEESKFDALIFQIDSDILDEDSFQNFLKKRGLGSDPAKTNIERGSAIAHILLSIAGHQSEQQAISKSEVVVPIVESSEAWLIAAENVTPNAEHLIGQPLIKAFGDLVARMSGKAPKPSYSKINKKVSTRKKLCASLVKVSGPAGRCHHYDDAIRKIRML